MNRIKVVVHLICARPHQTPDARRLIARVASNNISILGPLKLSTQNPKNKPTRAKIIKHKTETQNACVIAREGTVVSGASGMRPSLDLGPSDQEIPASLDQVTLALSCLSVVSSGLESKSENCAAAKNKSVSD